jgi:adenine/guanine phosphoribosyltransferase-like PRPP-binding protein
MSGVEPVRVSVCPRRNTDQRPYKVLMNVSGDTPEFAIVPNELRAVAKALADALVTDPAPDYVIGFAPGGIPLAVALAYVLELPAVMAYKTRLDLPDELTWSEPHAVNSAFYFYGAVPGTSVLLVDDEADSGNTLVNAVDALRAAGVRILDVGSAVEVLHQGRSGGRERLAERGLHLKSLTRIEVEQPDEIAQRPEHVTAETVGG